MASTLKVNTIAHTGGTTALTTDSSGRVFRSNIPQWFASFSAQSGVDYAGDWNKLQFVKDTEYGIPASSDFDDTNNRYVAPVAGLYWHSWSIRADGFSGGYIHCESRKNNNSMSKYRSITGGAGTNYESIGCQGIVYLGVGDYIEAFVNFSGDSSVDLDNDANFHGYLIG
jgi:hypothetical protein